MYSAAAPHRRNPVPPLFRFDGERRNKDMCHGPTKWRVTATRRRVRATLLTLPDALCYRPKHAVNEARVVVSDHAMKSIFVFCGRGHWRLMRRSPDNHRRMTNSTCVMPLECIALNKRCYLIVEAQPNTA